MCSMKGPSLIFRSDTLLVLSICFLATFADAANKPSASKSKSISYGSASLQGQRPYQEDRRIVEKINSSLTLAAVFDGHRNDAAADFLAKNFPDIVRKQLTNQLYKNLPGCPILSALDRSFSQANHLLS